MSKKKRVKAWVAISPEIEGSNIYMPRGDFAIFESQEQGTNYGFEERELVPCTIEYTVEGGKHDKA